MIRKSISLSLCILFLSSAIFYGCSGNSDTAGSSPADNGPVAASSSGKASKSNKASSTNSGKKRDSKPQVLTPQASGKVNLGNDFAEIDASNASEGYFMVKYLGTNQKVKLRVIGPNDSEYVYLLSGPGTYETFPLPCGNGTYEIQVLENAMGDKYAIVCSSELEVTVKDKFKPFLYPNQYVDFDKDSEAVELGSELAKDLSSELEVIENIYHYITKEITYDEQKAATVTYGYLPDIDDTLKSKKGICFDYASVMTAMLRSQGIPTKLEIGYSGEAYHAWISTYVEDIGWIDKIIEFNGKSWTLMDPTLAANNSNKAVGQYIGDGSNYVVKFSY